MDLEKEFDGLAALAGIGVEEAERPKLVEDMQSILGYVEQLQKLPVSDQTFARDTKKATDYREDAVIACSPKEADGVRDNFPAKTKEGLLEAHSALTHK